MKVIETGILSRSVPDTSRAVFTFPSILLLSNGTLLATYRSGSTKDSPDETVELCYSLDGGRNWSKPERCFDVPTLEGVHGSLKLCYLTELEPGHLIAASMWIDRGTYPDKPLFNPETEGCLPIHILLADSFNFGETWTPWRVIPMPVDIGPPSLTNPILKLHDGTLAMSIETNKHYNDNTKWYQRVVLLHSIDLGKTWGKPVTAGQDLTGRIFNWDQRVGVTPDGRIATFLWTYDSETHAFLNVHRRLSSDGGQTWSPAEDLGFADQPSHPAILPDGRIVLAWVDRFKTRSIRARLARSIEAAFDPETEVVIYSHSTVRAQDSDVSGALESSLWTFGLPFAEALPDADVLILYYAGTETSMDIHWSQLHLK